MTVELSELFFSNLSGVLNALDCGEGVFNLFSLKGNCNFFSVYSKELDVFFKSALYWSVRIFEFISSSFSLFCIFNFLLIVELSIKFGKLLPVIFNRVIGSSLQKLANQGPAVSNAFVGLDDDAVLLLGPPLLVYIWVQVVEPPFPALLPYSTGQKLRDIAPVFRPVFLYLWNFIRLLLLVALSCRPPPASRALWSGLGSAPAGYRGLNTFCHLCRHWTSDRSLKYEAIFFQFLAPNYWTKFFNFSSSSFSQNRFYDWAFKFTSPFVRIYWMWLWIWFTIAESLCLLTLDYYAGFTFAGVLLVDVRLFRVFVVAWVFFIFWVRFWVFIDLILGILHSSRRELEPFSF